MSNRFTAFSKPGIHNKKIGIIIPGAGSAHRMPDIYRPKFNIEIDGQSLWQYQIDTIRDYFVSPDIIYVGGYEFTKLKKELPGNIRLIKNSNFAKNNVCQSIHLGLLANVLDSVLIIYGDLYFNKNIFKDLDNVSCILYNDEPAKTNEVGVNIQDEYATFFSYKIKQKWSQIVYLTGKELELAEDLSGLESNENIFGFELLNQIIDHGGKFKAIPTKEYVIDLDTQEDIKKLKKYIINKEES